MRYNIKHTNPMKSCPFPLSNHGYRHQAQQGSQGPQDQAKVPGYLFELACQGKKNVKNFKYELVLF